MGFPQKGKGDWIPAPYIIPHNNAFVYCFLKLNKDRRALIRGLKTRLVKALMSTAKLDVTEHANVLCTAQKVK